MLHAFILPNHWTNAVRLSLEDLAKDGKRLKVKRFEIDGNLKTFHQLVLTVEAHPFDILQLGVKIGVMLQKEITDL